MLLSIGREGGKYINTKGNNLLNVLIADASATSATLNIMHYLSRPFAFVFSPDSSPGELSCCSTDHRHKSPMLHSKEEFEGPKEHAIVFKNVRCHNITPTDNPFSLILSRGQFDFPIFGP